VRLLREGTVTLLLFLGGLVLTGGIVAVLLSATGDRRLVHADHDLPEPARHARRTPKRT
jgi:hypothetical protein